MVQAELHIRRLLRDAQQSRPRQRPPRPPRGAAPLPLRPTLRTRLRPRHLHARTERQEPPPRPRRGASPVRRAAAMVRRGPTERRRRHGPARVQPRSGAVPRHRRRRSAALPPPHDARGHSLPSHLRPRRAPPLAHPRRRRPATARRQGEVAGEARPPIPARRDLLPQGDIHPAGRLRAAAQGEPVPDRGGAAARANGGRVPPPRRLGLGRPPLRPAGGGGDPRKRGRPLHPHPQQGGRIRRGRPRPRRPLARVPALPLPAALSLLRRVPPGARLRPHGVRGIPLRLQPREPARAGERPPRGRRGRERPLLRPHPAQALRARLRWLPQGRPGRDAEVRRGPRPGGDLPPQAAPLPALRPEQDPHAEPGPLPQRPAAEGRPPPLPVAPRARPQRGQSLLRQARHRPARRGLRGAALLHRLLRQGGPVRGAQGG